MKNYFILFLFASLFIFNAQAQTELKLNPLAVLGGVGILSVEQGFGDNFGVEATAVAFEDEGLFGLSGKYYLNPQRGLDKFHVGGFLASDTEANMVLGFLFGTKIVSESGLLFEAGIGAGRLLTDNSSFGNVVPYFKLDIGYRFGGKK